MSALARQLKWWLAALLGWSLIGAAGAASAPEFTGAGATLPEPLYRRWADAYRRASGAHIAYAAVGSWAGIKLVGAGQVEFGASDVPLDDEGLARDGLIQFPVVVAAVVPVVRVDGVPAGRLRLTGAVLADIYLGRIRHWNDAALQALNPGLSLPADAITVVRRSDASGTSFLFTRYLARSSPAWQARAGHGAAVDWPTGIGARGNAGVADFVRRIPGSIGYVDQAHAGLFGLSVARLRTDDGQDVAADARSIEAASHRVEGLSGASGGPVAAAPSSAPAWPIAGATYVLMQRIQTQPQRAAAVLKWLSWAFASGDGTALELGYQPLAPAVKQQVAERWARELKDARGAPIATP